MLAEQRQRRTRTWAQGEAYHAIAEEGVPFRLIAEAIGRQVRVPPKSLTQEEAQAHFGGLAMWVARPTFESLPLNESLQMPVSDLEMRFLASDISLLS